MSSGTNDTERNRDGRWTKDDMQYMQDNINELSIEDMALQMKRNPKTVKKYCIEKLGWEDDSFKATVARFDIKRSPIWEELKMQLSDPELDTFLYHWRNILAQFQKDMPLATERMQIVELIRIEILINRVMRKLKDTDILYKKTEDELEQEKELPKDQRNDMKLARLEMLIASLNTSRTSLSRDYKEFMTKKEDMLRTLKATREARIKRIENSQESLATWMSALVDNSEFRKSLGIQLKKQQLALYSERDRLSEYHTFLDGTIQQVVVNCDTLKDDNV